MKASASMRADAMEHKDSTAEESNPPGVFGEVINAEEEAIDEGFYANVVARGTRFVPSTIPMSVSQEIEPINNDRVLHSFAIPYNGIIFKVSPGREGYSLPVALPPGRYPFYCKFHATKGMRGVIVMGASREVILMRRGY